MTDDERELLLLVAGIARKQIAAASILNQSACDRLDAMIRRITGLRPGEPESDAAFRARFIDGPNKDGFVLTKGTPFYRAAQLATGEVLDALAECRGYHRMFG